MITEHSDDLSRSRRRLRLIITPHVVDREPPVSKYIMDRKKRTGTQRQTELAPPAIHPETHREAGHVHNTIFALIGSKAEVIGFSALSVVLSNS